MTDEGSRRQQAEELVAQFLVDEELGRAPSRADWLERQGDLRELVEPLLAAHARVHTSLARVASSVGERRSSAQRLAKQLGFETPEPITLREASDEPGQLVRPSKGPGRPRVFAERYELRGEIARGGMGVVHRVWDVELRRSLAVKTLGQGDLDGDSPWRAPTERELSRFLEEAQITAQLDHPGVVPLHELGVDDGGRVYFTMRLVKGRDLKRIIELARSGEEGWSLPRAAGVLLKVCETMAYAHAKGVLHRDLKPSNVMVGNWGEVYVMDWGIARVLGRVDSRDLRLRAAPTTQTSVHTERRDEREAAPDSPLITVDGTVLGTPSYMSPEQAEGRIEAMEPRSDVYSVGAMLYELLCGEAPYVRPGARLSPRTILAALLLQAPRNVEEIDPLAPPELVAICKRAMTREANQRYASMAELASDLRAWLEGRVVQAYEQGAFAELRKWVKRNKLAAASMGVTIVAVGAAFTQASVAEARTKTALSDRKYALSFAGQSLFFRETKMARNRLALLPVHRRGWEWIHLARWSDGAELVVHELGAKATATVHARDGEHVYIGLADGRVVVFEPATGLASPFVQGSTSDAGVSALAVAADGSRVAVGFDDGHALLASADGHLIAEFDAHDEKLSCLDFSPDGSLLATGSWDGWLRLWSAADGASTNRQAPPDLPGFGNLNCLAFSPDGTQIATGSMDLTVRLWNVDALDVRVRLLGHMKSVRALCFRPDGHMLATATEDGAVRLWETDKGGLISANSVGVSFVSALSFESSGTTLVAGFNDGALQRFDVREDGKSLHRRDALLGHEGFVSALSIDRSSGRVATCSPDGTVRLWNLDAPPHRTAVANQGLTTTAIALSATHPWLATAQEDGSVRIWERESLKAVKVLATGPGRASEPKTTAVAFSPDGRLLAVGHKLNGHEPSTIRTVDLETGSSVAATEGPDSDVRGLWFEADGARLLAAWGSGDVKVMNAKGDALAVIAQVDGELLASVVMAPGRGWLVCGTESGTIELRDAETLASMGTLEGHTKSVRSVAISSDEQWLVSGSADETARIWDLASRRCTTFLTGHTGSVNAAAFNADASRAFTGGNDGTICVWRVEDGELLLVLRGHERPIQCFVYDAASERLYSGGSDYRLIAWNGAPLPAPPYWATRD